MAWSAHAPNGTYRNFKLSADVRREAIADTVLFPFLKPEPGFGRKSGSSMTITRILAMGSGARVGELEQLPTARPQIVTKTVSVSEWGVKIPLTEFEEDVTKYELASEFRESLREHMRLTLDQMAGDALKLTTHKYTPTTAGYTLATNGSAGATATRNLQVADIRNIGDLFKSGNSGASAPVPPYRNGNYVGILSVQAARGVKNDPTFADWLSPTTSRPLREGLESIGVIENVELIVSNNTDVLAEDVGASTTTGEAIFFGRDAAGLLEVRAPEIRMSMPLPDDLGRSRYIGWVGTLEGFHTWETAALFRAIHVTSS